MLETQYSGVIVYCHNITECIYIICPVEIPKGSFIERAYYSIPQSSKQTEVQYKAELSILKNRDNKITSEWIQYFIGFGDGQMDETLTEDINHAPAAF